MTSPTTNLTAVFTVSNKTAPANVTLSDLDSWMIGDNGTILPGWNTLNTTQSPTTKDLYAILIVNETSGWAVGGNSTTVKIFPAQGHLEQLKQTTYRKVTGQEHSDTVNATKYGIDMDIDGNPDALLKLKATLFSRGNRMGRDPNEIENDRRSVSIIPILTHSDKLGPSVTMARLFSGMGLDVLDKRAMRIQPIGQRCPGFTVYKVLPIMLGM